jgi:hypothetical protein
VRRHYQTRAVLGFALFCGNYHYLFDAVVLLYPRTTGAFDPATAEWIALLQGGWLE